MSQLQPDTVYALAAAGDTLYVGRASGLYRSRDGSESWQGTFASPERGARVPVTALAAQGRSIFAGMTGAMVRSLDAGESWQIVGLPTPPPSVVALALSPNYDEDGIVAAGTAEDGVFLSNDWGESWIPWNYGLIDLRINALVFSSHFSTNRTIFAGTESGIFRSHNAGRSWSEVPFPMPFAPVLSVAITSEGRLIAGTENHGVFISDDDGGTWQQIDGGFSEAAVNAIQIADAQVWLLLDDGLVVSSDGGATWNRDARPLPPDTLAMALLLPPASPGAALVGFADGKILQLC